MENLKETKKEFFLHNGEMLLRKRIAFWGERAYPIRIFSAEELRTSIESKGDVRMRKGCMDGRSFTVNFSESHDEAKFVTDEIAILANIRHRNVVRLLGCCLETQCPIPVYEFISGGKTLFHHLHPRHQGTVLLHWSDRMRIAAEVADALNYLHTHSSTAIIHRDVRPENILLDDRLTAKLTGFQWSFPMPTVGRKDFETSVPTVGSCIEKSDVHALGKVMLLLLTGKENYYYYEMDRLISIMEIFASYLKKGCYTGIPNQGKTEQIEAFLLCEGKTEQVEAFCEVALKRIDKKEESRPTMEEVVQMLRQIRNM